MLLEITSILVLEKLLCSRNDLPLSLHSHLLEWEQEVRRKARLEATRAVGSEPGAQRQLTALSVAHVPTGAAFAWGIS